MTFKEIFLARLDVIRNDQQLIEQFVSTSLRDQKRVFKVLNTNIKTLNTYATYIKDIFAKENDPNLDIDNHQKDQVCRDMRIFYDGNNEEERERVNIRKRIALAIGEEFEKNKAFYKILLLFILGLNSNYNISEGSEYLFETLPPSLLDHFDDHLKSVLTENNGASIVNPAYGVFVFYPDVDLLDAYLDFYNYEFDDFIETLSQIEDENISFIAQRISNCQSSSLKQEGLLFSLYRMISELELQDKSYDEVVHLIADQAEEKVNFFKNRPDKIGTTCTIDADEKERFINFLLNLSAEEKEEIFECLGNSESLGTIESYVWSGRLAKREPVSEHEEGGDVIRTSSSRRGQTKFKKNLVNRIKRQQGRCRCAICGCTIEGENYLIASHILPWKYANVEEKVDGNNGLLLCPNHDFLFDGLKISFDEEGRIMISDELSDANIRSFKINRETRIEMTPEVEVFMARHRRAFRRKGWNR